MGGHDHSAADERAAEHLPRLADAADAARDPVFTDGYTLIRLPDDEPLDLTGEEVTGPDRRLDGYVEPAEGEDITADPVAYFRYDPDTDDTTDEPPPGTRLDGNGNLIADGNG